MWLRQMPVSCCSKYWAVFWYGWVWLTIPGPDFHEDIGILWLADMSPGIPCFVLRGSFCISMSNCPFPLFSFQKLSYVCVYFCLPMSVHHVRVMPTEAREDIGVQIWGGWGPPHSSACNRSVGDQISRLSNSQVEEMTRECAESHLSQSALWPW